MKHYFLAFALIAFTSMPAGAQDHEHGGGAEEAAKKWFENLEITVGITAAVQGASGNNDPADASASDDADYTHSVDIEFASEIEPGHRVVVALESGHGDGQNARIGSSTFRPFYDPYSTVVSDSNHKEAVTVSAAYYEGTFSEGKLMLMVGKMDCHSMIDQNAFANDETAQFMGGPFVRQAGALYPELGKQGQYYANGVMLMLAPSDLLDITLMAANPEDSGLGKHGHFAGQLNLKPKFLGLDGNYRFYYLKDYRDFQNIKDGSISSSNGMGVSFDQFITDNTGIFFRYGAQDAKGEVITFDGGGVYQVNHIDPLESVISGGLHFGGGAWDRKDDEAGIGYAVGKMKADLAALDTTITGDQTMWEVYYRWQVFEKMGITPDVQMHSNLPRAEKRSVTFIGLRAQLDF
ncbi:MAG: carbohydrate porin [Nitrospinae bacterium]|nr:carbohydrate porin [Nitrospinota bacterium]